MRCWWHYRLFYSHISGETEKFMLNLLRKRWWKFVSVAFLLFALVAGMYFPLSSGITQVSPEKINAGNVAVLDINLYNAGFNKSLGANIKAQKPTVYLRSDGVSFCSSNVTITDDNNLKAYFDIPLPIGLDGTNYFDIIITSAWTGTVFLKDGVAIVSTGEVSDSIYNCAPKIEVIASPGLTFPHREILYESIRNLFYHVPMWFAMLFLLMFSFGSSIAYLNSSKMIYDVFAKEAAFVAMLFGTLGIVTGMTWANFTWGAPWTNDPKLNGAAVGMLTYLAYFVLRGSLTQRDQRAKVAAVYGIFAFVIYIIFIFVLPRLSDSLHPGNGGNPAFSNYDLDNSLRPIFYSAVIGFTGIGYWIMSLRIRYTILHDKQQEQIEQPYESMVS